MGKVLRTFPNGYPGAISRAVDDIVISLRNASGANIPYGAPVFLVSGERACTTFDASTSTFDRFLGIAVRAADKTPEEYGSSVSSYAPNDPVDILVRGSTVLNLSGAAAPGASVYIRKADGMFVTAAGAEGTTLKLDNLTVRTSRDRNSCVEVVIRERNVI